MQAWVNTALLSALLAAAIASGCSSPGSCTNEVHPSCALDAGCASGVCIPATESIDPCPTGAEGCCFETCVNTKTCPSSTTCVTLDGVSGGVCSYGTCVGADGG